MDRISNPIKRTWNAIAQLQTAITLVQWILSPKWLAAIGAILGGGIGVVIKADWRTVVFISIGTAVLVIVIQYVIAWTIKQIPAQAIGAFTPKWIRKRKISKEWPGGTWYGDTYVFTQPEAIGQMKFKPVETPPYLKDDLRAMYNAYDAAQAESPVSHELQKLKVHKLPSNIRMKIRFKIKEYTGVKGFVLHRSEQTRNEPIFQKTGEFDDIIIDCQKWMFGELLVNDSKEEETQVFLYALEWTI